MRCLPETWAVKYVLCAVRGDEAARPEANGSEEEFSISWVGRIEKGWGGGKISLSQVRKENCRRTRFIHQLVCIWDEHWVDGNDACNFRVITSTYHIPSFPSQVWPLAPTTWFYSRLWGMVKREQWCQWNSRKGSQDRSMVGEVWGGWVYPRLYQLACPLPNCLLIFVSCLFDRTTYIHIAAGIHN